MLTVGGGPRTIERPCGFSDQVAHFGDGHGAHTAGTYVDADHGTGG